MYFWQENINLSIFISIIGQTLWNYYYNMINIKKLHEHYLVSYSIDETVYLNGYNFAYFSLY